MARVFWADEHAGDEPDGVAVPYIVISTVTMGCKYGRDPAIDIRNLTELCSCSVCCRCLFV